MPEVGPMEKPTASEQSLAEAYVDALASRNPEKLQACLHPEVRLRAVVPSGYRESTGVAAVVARLESWFQDPDRIEVLSRAVYHVSDRLHIRYRFGEHYSDGDTEVIEQDAYCGIREGRIDSIDLLCSGHLPGPERRDAAVHRFDAGDLGCGSGLPQEFRRQISALPVGGILETSARDPAAKEDLPALARMLGHQVLSVTTSPEGQTIVTVQRGR